MTPDISAGGDNVGGQPASLPSDAAASSCAPLAVLSSLTPQVPSFPLYLPPVPAPCPLPAIAFPGGCPLPGGEKGHGLRLDSVRDGIRGWPLGAGRVDSPVCGDRASTWTGQAGQSGGSSPPSQAPPGPARESVGVPDKVYFHPESGKTGNSRSASTGHRGVRKGLGIPGSWAGGLEAGVATAQF